MCRDLLGNGTLYPHAFDEEIVLLVLLDWIPGGKTMKVVVPDSVSDQLVPRRQSVAGRVDEELTRVHIGSLSRFVGAACTPYRTAGDSALRTL